jgi:hypothetical protein
MVAQPLSEAVSSLRCRCMVAEVVLSANTSQASGDINSISAGVIVLFLSTMKDGWTDEPCYDTTPILICFQRICKGAHNAHNIQRNIAWFKLTRLHTVARNVREIRKGLPGMQCSDWPPRHHKQHMMRDIVCIDVDVLSPSQQENHSTRSFD